MIRRAQYTKMEELKEDFSIESAIQGGYQQCLPTDQCYCYSAKGINIPSGGMCYPECMCDDCRLEQSGLCEQDAGDSDVPGV